MTVQEWRDELATYTSVRQCLEETKIGIDDHLKPCTKGNTRTVATTGPQPRYPFKQEPTVCDRGTSGCALEHNDHQALIFMQMAVDRALEIA